MNERTRTNRTPFWNSTTMHGEGLFFVQDKPGERARANLLFAPEKMLALTSADGGTTYAEGQDYLFVPGRRAVELPVGSRVPFKTTAEIYPAATADMPAYPPGRENLAQKMPHKTGDPGACLLFSEGSFFHRLQVEATYTHSGREWRQWNGYVPRLAERELPGTFHKLRAGQPLALVLTGDSISAGGNASGFTKAPPFTPPYGELVAQGLGAAYESRVTYRNLAVGGWTSDDGLRDLPRIVAAKPDLLVVAYGMNDRGSATYIPNIQAILAAVRGQSPDAEFILVASMIGNTDWNRMRRESFLAMRDELAGLVGPGVALADLTAVWDELLRNGRKRWHDLGGNGVNHPNDFGHRLYAQAVLGLLTDVGG